MPHHFSLMIDKSALQALSLREAEWLFHHFRVNMPVVFFAELIGDLKKEKALSTGTGAGDVRMLAAKVDAAFTDLNAEAHKIVAMELSGATFEMDGRPLLANAEYVRMPDGRYGMYIDQTPAQRIVDRWRAGDFHFMEEAFSQVWRERISNTNLETIVRSGRGARKKFITTPEAVSAFVDDLIFGANRNHFNLVSWMDALQVPPRVKREVVERWKRQGRPPAKEFVPYTAHVARVEMFFVVAIGHRVVTTRSSNVIDMEYLKYLPFTREFCSSDRLHSELFPHLSFNYNLFIEGRDLKSALRELADYYESMTDEQKAQGSFTYADYPPVHLDNAITRAYDKLYPNWRTGANEPKPPRDPQRDAEIMKRLRPMMAAMEAHRKGQ